MERRYLDERDVDRIMKQIVLVGVQGTKRTIYFEKAAALEGAELEFVDWKDWDAWAERCERTNTCIKIDPFLYQSGNLEEMNHLVGEYHEKLMQMKAVGEQHGSFYLNEPDAIWSVLDKASCKDVLRQAGCAVTHSFGMASHTAERLLDKMREEHIVSVFLKPVLGSGAAGVTAFRVQRSTGRMVLYTCAAVKEIEEAERAEELREADRGVGTSHVRKKRILVNTKHLMRMEDEAKIRQYLDILLPVGCLMEQWYPKEKLGDATYDLRAVYQFGQLDYVLARLSKGPITNLQLNNHPLAYEELGLPVAVRADIEELCRAAASCFPGLRSVGIDILLERGSRKPRIIEMNGQGDLLYQDIYNKNVIYRRQVSCMMAPAYGR